MKKVLVLVVLLSLLYPSTAQAEWIQHPLATGGTWWCDYYYDGGPYAGYSYWCMDEYDNWFRARPGWQYSSSQGG